MLPGESNGRAYFCALDSLPTMWVNLYGHLLVRELQQDAPGFFDVLGYSAEYGGEQLTIWNRGAGGKQNQIYFPLEGIAMALEKKSDRPAITPAQLQQIQEMADSIRYGSLTLVFQDGYLIQIERNEKIRIPKTS